MADAPVLEAPDAPEEARFTVRYDAAMVHRGVRTFVWRRVLRTSWFFGSAGGSLGLIAFGRLAPAARFGVPFGACLLAVLVGIVGLAWKSHLDASLGRLRGMSPPEALVTVSPARMGFRSSLAEAALPWSSFTEVWRLPGLWMLFTSPGGFNLLPTGDIRPEVLQLLTRRLPTERRRA